MTDTKLTITLSGDNSQLEAALQKSTDGIREFAGSVVTMAIGFGSIAEGAQMMVHKIAEMGQALAEFAPKAFEEVNTTARSFEGLSFKTGESLHSLNIYRTTMDMAGGSLEDLDGWIKGVTQSMSAHSKVFLANGIAATESALMQEKPIEVMRRAVALIETEADQNKKLILTRELLGRSGLEAIPQMRRFFETMDEGRKVTEGLDHEINDKTIKAMQEAEKRAGELKARMDDLKAGVAENYEPWDRFFAMMNRGFLHVADFVLQAVNGIGTLWEWLKKNVNAQFGIYAEAGQGMGDLQKADAPARATQTHGKTAEEITAEEEKRKAAADKARKAAEEQNRELMAGLEKMAEEEKQRRELIHRASMETEKEHQEEEKKAQKDYDDALKKNLDTVVRVHAEEAKALEAAYQNPAWVTAAEGALNHIANDTARALTEMQRHHMTFAQTLKGIWLGVESSIVGSLVKVEAEQLKSATIDKAVAAMKAAAAGTSAASIQSYDAAMMATDSAKEVSSEKTAAANFFSWFSALGPFGIPAAIAAIAVMTAAIGKIVAHAVGGEISQPTLALMGEAGSEIVAPKEDFLQVTRSLVASGAAMYGAIVASQARVDGYARTSYLPDRSQMGEGGSGGVVVNVHGHVIGEGQQSASVLGRLTKQSLDQYNRRRG